MLSFLFTALLAACGTPSAPTTAPTTPRANAAIVAAPLTKEGIPAKLGALTLTQSKMGSAALAEFAQMHGKGFDLIGGYVAQYAGAGSTATLWVAQAKDAPAAQEMTEQMAARIGAGNAVFTNLQSLNIGGRILYQVDGMGQAHFFYAVNDKIVWVGVDDAQAGEVLHALWSAVR
jgi:hypothetical protein